MPVKDVVILGFIIAAFVVFTMTLAWASWREGEPKVPKQTVLQTPINSINPRHA